MELFSQEKEIEHEGSYNDLKNVESGGNCFKLLEALRENLDLRNIEGVPFFL
jgi:hypothetical protein